MLAQVNVLLSNVDAQLSKCQDVNQSTIPVLPRIGVILSQMESIVSKHVFDTSPTNNLSWDDTSHAVWYHEEEEDVFEEDEEEEHVNEDDEMKNVNEEEEYKEEEVEDAEEKKDNVTRKEGDEVSGEEEENHEEMSIAHRVKRRKMSKLFPSISFNCQLFYP